MHSTNRSPNGLNYLLKPLSSSTLNTLSSTTIAPIGTLCFSKSACTRLPRPTSVVTFPLVLAKLKKNGRETELWLELGLPFSPREVSLLRRERKMRALRKLPTSDSADPFAKMGPNVGRHAQLTPTQGSMADQMMMLASSSWGRVSYAHW